MILTKTTAALNEVALSYHKARGLYFSAVAFAASLAWFIDDKYNSVLL